MAESNHITRIALVGASGNIGTSILKNLLKIPSLHLTILSRLDSTAVFPESSQITVLKGSYDDDAFLQSAFSGSQMAIFTLSMAAIPSQPRLIQAAAKAGVKWILPNEWAGDGANEELVKNVSLMWPKRDTRKYIEEEFENLKWIGVVTGPWTELSILSGLFGVNPKERKVVLDEDSGIWSSSSMDMVGKAVARLVQLPISNDENPRKSLNFYGNNFLYVSSFGLSQKALFEAAKKVTGTNDEEWRVEKGNISERIQIMKNKLEQDPEDLNSNFAYTYGFYMGEGRGGNYEAKAISDREVLGLEEENLEVIVKGSLNGVW